MGSLTWFTDYFGEPQRQYVNNLFNYYMTFSAEIGDVEGSVDFPLSSQSYCLLNRGI